MHLLQHVRPIMCKTYSNGVSQDIERFGILWGSQSQNWTDFQRIGFRSLYSSLFLCCVWQVVENLHDRSNSSSSKPAAPREIQESSRLIVKNLPKRITESRLREFLQKQGGHITDVKIILTEYVASQIVLARERQELNSNPIYSLRSTFHHTPLDKNSSIAY